MENKRREWVKTAAIIFLTIMLLLTFFSNTIMNYSLPEVSAKYVQSGSLSEQIRGTAAVEAAQQYEVKYTGASRVVQAVEVKQGDTVEKGQVLLRFEEGESPDLQQAQSDLEAKQDEYRTKLLDAGVDYSADELSIKNLQEDIARLKESLGGSDDYLKKLDEQKALEDKINDLTKQSNELTKESKVFEDALTHITEQLTALSSDDYESLDDVYSKELSPLYDNVVKYKAEKEKYDKKVEQITKELGKEVTNEDIINKQAEIEKLQSQLSSLNQKYLDALFDDKADIISINQSISDTNTDLGKARSELYELYNKQTTSNLISQKLKTATNNQTTFTNSFTNAENKLNLKKIEVSKKLNAEKKSVKAKADKKNNELDNVKAEIEDVKLDKTQADADLETINSIESKERDLESQRLALQKKQKDDLVAAGKDDIATEALQRDIKRLEEKVEKLKADAAGGEITAQVAGVISSMKIVAGETLESGTSVASIEMTEKGYTASFSVTLDQAKKVKVGDNADIQYFWGGEAQAKLTQIKADQSDSQKKQLVFSAHGYKHLYKLTERFCGHSSRRLYTRRASASSR